MKESVRIEDKVFKPYLSNAEILAAIQGVADRMNEAYRGTGKVPVLLCILEGSLLFTAELLKRLDFDCELMSLRVSSYKGTHSTGNVAEVVGLTRSVEGREVIVCEDIVDTGRTLEMLDTYLKAKGASAVKYCTMLLKPESYNRPMPIDWCAMEIEDKFIVGFGLDYNQRGRNLVDIYQISE